MTHLHSQNPIQDARLLPAVEAEIGRLARTTDGKVGVCARHLERDLAVCFNAFEPFPMASTFKVAVAGAVLALVDSGDFTIDHMVTIDPAMMMPSHGIASVFPFTGIAASVRNLMESMLTQSDNTTTDVLVKLAGGPSAVTAWVQKAGIDGMRIDGDTRSIISRYLGVSLPPDTPLGDVIDSEISEDPDTERKRNAVFDSDPRDTTAPAAMVSLLSKLVCDGVLSSTSTEALLGPMQRCITGVNRLRGFLPPGTPVWDKTGTIGGTVNDVGIIELPDGLGRFAIATYITGSTRPIEQRERLLAHLARLVYDYMLFGSTNP